MCFINSFLLSFISLHQAANPFFKLLTMLMEFAGGPPGMPSFASYILQRIWEVNTCASVTDTEIQFTVLLLYTNKFYVCFFNVEAIIFSY